MEIRPHPGPLPADRERGKTDGIGWNRDRITSSRIGRIFAEVRW